ncbi:transcription factor bim3 [Phtheirospermum japonicum]|uniref:Transcription factor bim3 n=1 Tax=Phtheirospermum japonicum TaxID=374723 RepID=A0A830CPZ7_9LAMI|nr:transcription factor bim3 [Phtheirospermum japonicum]
MVRTARHHVEDEETHDSSSPTESKRGDRKINPSRSKHSETEQRRRSKINERFQMLRELIPENDQKRDKASFLLEVIHYVQFLKEKLQIYEGSSQEWSPEPAKCFPLRMNSGPVESFIDQSQFDRNFAGHEDNVLDTAFLSNAQNMPPIFQGVAGQPYQGSFPDAEQVGHQPRAPLWPGRSCGDDCSVPNYAANEDEPKSESGEARFRNHENYYGEVLIDGNTHLKVIAISDVLPFCGSSYSTQNPSEGLGERGTQRMDDENGSCLDYGAPMNISENYEQPPKRFRANQT